MHLAELTQNGAQRLGASPRLPVHEPAILIKLKNHDQLSNSNEESFLGRSFHLLKKRLVHMLSRHLDLHRCACNGYIIIYWL